MKKLIIVVLGLLISLSVSAQQQISGTIVDDDGQPILGALVTIPGTSQSTTTTFDGSFRLELDTQIEQIQIDYFGYNNKLVYIDTDEIIHDLGTIKMTLNYKYRFAKKSNFIFISAQTANSLKTMQHTVAKRFIYRKHNITLWNTQAISQKVVTFFAEVESWSRLALFVWDCNRRAMRIA